MDTTSDVASAIFLIPIEATIDIKYILCNIRIMVAQEHHVPDVHEQNGVSLKVLTLPTLRVIQEEVVRQLLANGFDQIFDTETAISKDGFRRTSIRTDVLQRFLDQYSLHQRELMIEIVEIFGNQNDDNGSTHVHEVANALTTALGEKHGLRSDAVGALYLCESEWSPAPATDCPVRNEETDKWKEINTGDSIEILAGQAHDFRCGESGYLSFLTVTSPEVGKDNERPDWVRAVVQ